MLMGWLLHTILGSLWQWPWPLTYFLNNIVRSISLLLCEVGIPNLLRAYILDRNTNLACGWILGWRRVAYHFQVTVTLPLTSDLVFRIFVFSNWLYRFLIFALLLTLEHISLINCGRNPKFGVCMHLVMAQCSVPSLGGHCDLDLWPCF